MAQVKTDPDRTGKITPERGRVAFRPDQNPMYAPGNHYNIERVEGAERGSRALVTYHKVQCFSTEDGGGVFFDLDASVFVTWKFLVDT